MTSYVAVVTFPGSNCEHDVVKALTSLGARAEIVWHQEPSLGDADSVVLPGGFAHGDYLRPGAIARFSPVMKDITRLASEGAPVLGICNGFQVLTEAGLLPGALTRNAGLRFVCRTVPCVVTSSSTMLTSDCEVGDILDLPVNHGEGNFVCDPDTLASLQDNGQIVLRYQDDVNGSLDRIAGISNKTGNVVALMPHPERAVDRLLGSTGGAILLKAWLASRSRTQ